MKKKPSYLWIIPGAFLFPALQILFLFIRALKFPTELLYESLVFAPMGFVSVAVLIYFLRKEEDKSRKTRIFRCFALSIPVALIISLMAGLISVYPLFITLCGTVPLIIGIIIGIKKT